MTPLIILVGAVLLSATIYIGYRIQVSERRLIPISVGAFIAGLFFESRRLSEKWQDILYVILGSFVLSFFAFLPTKGEDFYDFENHIETWPYCFIFLFIIVSIALHKNKVTPRLTEGITLLQSVAVIYWAIDHGFIATENLFLKFLVAIGLLLSLFSVFHAFTHMILSPANRLILSIWSSVIMMLFAAENIYRAYQNEEIESAVDMTHGFYIGLQYFLVGVSSIYVVQNLFMLMGFLPGKRSFFNSRYFSELEILKKDHINRYSDRQINVLHALFCVLFAGVIFFLNHHYQLLPRHTAIWAAFVIFPFVLDLYSALSRARA